MESKTNRKVFKVRLANEELGKDQMKQLKLVELESVPS